MAFLKTTAAELPEKTAFISMQNGFFKGFFNLTFKSLK
jgi:hypothetical protein